MYLTHLYFKLSTDKILFFFTQQGRQAMEWAIGKIKLETLELSRKVEESMEDFNRKAHSAQKNMEGLSRKALEDMETIIPPKPSSLWQNFWLRYFRNWLFKINLEITNVIPAAALIFD